MPRSAVDAARHHAANANAESAAGEVRTESHGPFAVNVAQRAERGRSANITSRKDIIKYIPAVTYL